MNHFELAFDNKMKNNNVLNDNELKKTIPDCLPIICPLCGYDSIIDLIDYKFELRGCKNGHKISNIPFHDFLCKFSGNWTKKEN